MAWILAHYIAAMLHLASQSKKNGVRFAERKERWRECAEQEDYYLLILDKCQSVRLVL